MPSPIMFTEAAFLFGPGFATDEPLEHLGERLMLPQWLEAQRAAIEEALPPLQLPVSGSPSAGQDPA